MINKNYSYEEITKLVLSEQKKISNPSVNDINIISKKLHIDKVTICNKYIRNIILLT